MLHVILLSDWSASVHAVDVVLFKKILDAPKYSSSTSVQLPEKQRKVRKTRTAAADFNLSSSLFFAAVHWIVQLNDNRLAVVLTNNSTDS
jgi:hypothetical protein